MARNVDPLNECRRRCFEAFKAAIAAAQVRFRDNFQACKDAYDAAVARCASDPDPVACRALASDNYTDCVRTVAQILSQDVETARITLENCLTMCNLQFPRP
jgi:hypothetical protein